MPALIYPRRAVSTATTITVNSNALPSWVPAPGEYADASLTTPALTSGVDPCPAGNCFYTATQGQAAIWTNWNGGAFAPNWGTYGSLILHGGGHWGYFGNEVLRYDIASRTFSRMNNPSNYGFNKDGWTPYTEAPASVVNNYGGFPDGQVNPLHTYCNFEFIPPEAGGGALGSVFFMHRPNSNSAVTQLRLWRFDLSAATWINTGVNIVKGWNNQGTPRHGFAYDSKRFGVWNVQNAEYANPQGISFYSFLTGVETDVPLNSGNTFTYGRPGHATIVYNAARDCLIINSLSGGVSGLFCVDLSNFTLGVSSFAPTHQITMSGTPHPNVIASTSFPQPMEYSSYDGNLYMINWPTDARLYKLTVPATLTGTWVWSSELLTPKSGTSSLAFDTNASTRPLDNNLFTRFKYVPGIKSFVWSDGINLKAQACRPSTFT